MRAIAREFADRAAKCLERRTRAELGFLDWLTDRCVAQVREREEAARAGHPATEPRNSNRLSKAEQDARKPLPPLVLLDAHEDPVHVEPGKARPARVVRATRHV